MVILSLIEDFEFSLTLSMTSVVNLCCGCSEGRMDPSAESGPGYQDVNPQFLQQLRELDIPEEAAKQVI